MCSPTTKMSASLLMMLACAFSAAHVSAVITLKHTYPQTGNFSLLDLRCQNTTTLFSSPTPLSGALFFVNDVLIPPQGNAVAGVTHVITPETEGALTCRDSGKVSEPLLLAAEPRVAYECSSDDRPFHYQLLQYSEQDQYTLPCVIKPGRLRSRYKIVWATVEPDSNVFTTHSTINPENFDLTLNSNFLPLNEEFLSCRVRIRHDSTTRHHLSYCGYRIQTAVQAEIVSVSESTTVEAGNSVNLTCTARGSQLHFKWTFRGQTFTKDESREGIRVRESSDTSPLTNTSRLMLSGSSGLLDDAGQHMVTCTVTQDLQPGFNHAVQSSSGELEITMRIPPPDDIPPPSITPTSGPPLTVPTDPETPGLEPTSHTPPAPPNALNDQHIKLIIVVIPITLITLVVCILLYLAYRKWQSKKRLQPGLSRENSGGSSSSGRSDSLALVTHECDGQALVKPPPKNLSIPGKCAFQRGLSCPDNYLTGPARTLSASIEERCHTDRRILHMNGTMEYVERITTEVTKKMSIASPLSEHAMQSSPVSISSPAPRGFLPSSRQPLSITSNPSSPGVPSPGVPSPGVPSPGVPAVNSSSAIDQQFSISSSTEGFDSPDGPMDAATGSPAGTPKIVVSNSSVNPPQPPQPLSALRGGSLQSSISAPFRQNSAPSPPIARGPPSRQTSEQHGRRVVTNREIRRQKQQARTAMSNNHQLTTSRSATYRRMVSEPCQIFSQIRTATENRRYSSDNPRQEMRPRGSLKSLREVSQGSVGAPVATAMSTCSKASPVSIGPTTPQDPVTMTIHQPNGAPLHVAIPLEPADGPLPTITEADHEPLAQQTEANTVDEAATEETGNRSLPIALDAEREDQRDTTSQ